MGTLFIVATPIGHLDDITLRAIGVLRGAAIIAAEDTRRTARLLRRHGIDTPMSSLHAHSSPRRLAALVERLEEDDVALVADAGTPGISDPGAALVAAAAEAGFQVVPVPGPSSLTAALSVSGLAGERFVFLGFLPRRGGPRRAALTKAAAMGLTIIAFEAPHRLAASLADMLAVLGDRPIVVARELTKMHEELWRGRLEEAAATWRSRRPRGEFTLVIAPGLARAEQWSPERLRSAVEALVEEGHGAKEASRRVAAEAGASPRDVYRLLHSAPGGAMGDDGPIPGGDTVKYRASGAAPGAADDEAADEAAGHEPGGGVSECGPRVDAGGSGGQE